MRNAGIAVLVGSIALTAVLLIVWLLGLVFGMTAGGLIHLLLVLAILTGPAGVILGCILLFIAHSRARKP